MEPLLFIIIALVIGAATRHFLKKTPLPFTVLLLIFGLGLGVLARLEFFHGIHSIEEALEWAGKIDPHVILFVFLPTLIFEAAFAMDVHTFKKSLGNASLLAIPGIVFALVLTALFLMGLKLLNIGFGTWEWKMALLFGSVISATDPVAVVALLKDLGASKKLGTLIEGESLLNDGTAIVIFMVIFVGITGSGHGGDSSIFVEFGKVAFGGILLGVIVGAITLAWVKKVFNDAMVEITLIIAAAYLTFFVAEHFLHVSGVLGLVALGLAMASAGRTRISAEVGHFLHEFWELAAFIANTLIFLIVGVVIASRTVFTLNDFVILLILYVGLHVIRLLLIIMFYPLMKKIGYGLPKKDAYVLWYGALRGAIGLALALIVAGEPNIPEEIRNQFLFYTAGIVTLTLLVNATTIKFLVNGLGLTDIPPVKAMMFSNAFKAIHKESKKEIDVLRKDRFMGGANWETVNTYLPHRELPKISDEEKEKMDPMAEARRRILEKEKSSYWNQFKEGLLSPLAFTKLSDNMNEIIDKEGNIPLSEREYLNSLWRIPKVFHYFETFPLVGSFAKKAVFERLGLSYDIARGFVVSQEEISKLVSSMDFDFNQDDQTDDEEERIAQSIKDEINENRLRGLNYIKEIHQGFPEITSSIETKQATRSILNFEKSAIAKLQKEGQLENDETEKMIVDVEKRMKKLMDSPLITTLMEPIEVLKDVSWLKAVDENVSSEVIKIAKEKDHKPGQKLIERGDSGKKGMVVIARGSVKVMVGDTVVDILGTGSVIGEMSVLAGVPRTANVIADTPVTALWLSSEDMQNVIKKSSELEINLWNTAGQRFAENLLGSIDPYMNWSQIKMRRWLSDFEIRKIKEDEKINLHNKIAVLVYGVASDKETGHVYQAPSVVDISEAVFSKNAWVMISEQK